MSSKLWWFVSVWLILIPAIQGDLCATEENFKSSDLNKSSNNVEFQYYFNNYATKLSSGSYGTVYSILKDNDTVIKFIDVRDSSNYSSYVREVKALKKICNREENDFKLQKNCVTNIIPPFHGCIKNKSSVYEFQARMAWDFSNDETLDAYRALPPFARLEVMLDIIDRFIVLHEQHKIIHGDIKPGNIMMKNKDFSDIRIIDFGMSGKNTDDYFNGTPGFFPYELRKTKENIISKLSYDIDTYALAMTFTIIEDKFNGYLDEIIKECNIDEVEEDKKFVDDMKSFDDLACKSELLRHAFYTFGANPELSFMENILRTAFSMEKKKRFQSMRELSQTISLFFKSSENGRKHLNNLFRNYHTQDPTKRFPSSWKDALAEEFSLKKINSETEKSKKPAEPSIFGKIFSSVSCSSSKKKVEKTNSPGSTRFEII